MALSSEPNLAAICSLSALLKTRAHRPECTGRMRWMSMPALPSRSDSEIVAAPKPSLCESERIIFGRDKPLIAGATPSRPTDQPSGVRSSSSQNNFFAASLPASHSDRRFSSFQATQTLSSSSVSQCSGFCAAIQGGEATKVFGRNIGSVYRRVLQLSVFNLAETA